MLNPGKAVDNPAKYHVSRKDKYALLCMAVADAHRKIIDYDISQTPTSHDSLAFTASALGKRIEQGDLEEPFFLNGDSAFNISPSMVTPTGGADDDFDFYQSSNRMPAECAFGILIRRFPVLWRPLQMAFEKRSAFIGACIRMHNFCIDMKLADEFSDGAMEGEVRQCVMIQPGKWR